MQIATGCAPFAAVPPVVVEDLVEDEQHVLLWQVCGESTVTTGDTPHHLAPGLAVWVPATTQHG